MPRRKLCTAEELKKLKKNKPFIKQSYLSGAYIPALAMGWVNEEGNVPAGMRACKEYLHMQVSSFIRGRSLASYDPRIKRNRLDLKTTRLAVCTRGHPYHKIANMYNFIRDIERDQGFKLCKPIYGGTAGYKGIYNIDRSSAEVWIVEADRRWMHAVPLIGFFSLAVRMGFDYKGEGWSNFLESGKSSRVTDKRYCTTSKGLWKRLIGKPVSSVFGPKRSKNFQKRCDFYEGYNHLSRVLDPSDPTVLPAKYSHWNIESLKKEAGNEK